MVDANNANKKWTKFSESPTFNVSSPGPKPVNVTTNIIDPSHVIYPVPLRVTPVGMEVADEEALKTFRNADALVYESGVIKAARGALDRGSSPKHNDLRKKSSYIQQQRDSLPSDLRAIQRPHPKKSVSKNIGAIPLPPETNLNNQMTSSVNSGAAVISIKKEVPPLPPPRYDSKFSKVSESFILFLVELIDMQEVVA